MAENEDDPRPSDWTEWRDLSAKSVADLVAEANRIIEARGVHTLFQPLVHLSTSEVVGYEALARGPEASPLCTPVALLGAARLANRLSELDWLCATTACAEAMAADLHPSMSVFLNFDPGTLLTPCPPDLLSTARSALDRLRVIVEVDEALLLANPGRLFDALAQVREIGWGVAIDNAAASPASLALLPMIQPDVVKLNLRSIRDAPRSIIEAGDGARLYAEQTGATILAEGIEDLDDVLLARAIGADYGQGFFFGRPGAIPEARSIPRSVFPLLPRTPTDGWASPFEVIRQSCPTSVGEARFLAPFATYLEQQTSANGPSALLLETLPRSRTVEDPVPGLDQFDELIGRCAFTAVIGPGIGAQCRWNARMVASEPDDPIGEEWTVIVLAPHYAGALVARDLGDTGDCDYRRYEYAITHQRELIQLAARGLLRRLGPLADSDGAEWWRSRS